MDADFLLLHRMQNGDDQAIDTFVQKYYPMILRYCRLHIKHTGFAEDLTQETFARFFRNFPQYQHYGKAANYLYVIAGNLCRDDYRRPEELPMAELPEQPVCQMEALDLRMDVHLALKQLPPELREVTILYFFQDIKQKEIARILGISLPLVKYRIRRAKEQLELLLGKEDQP
ncbi:MAG: RNA polymerase sigma factor [Faecousia sp.]